DDRQVAGRVVLDLVLNGPFDLDVADVALPPLGVPVPQVELYRLQVRDAVAAAGEAVEGVLDGVTGEALRQLELIGERRVGLLPLVDLADGETRSGRCLLQSGAGGDQLEVRRPLTLDALELDLGRRRHRQQPRAGRRRLLRVAVDAGHLHLDLAQAAAGLVLRRLPGLVGVCVAVADGLAALNAEATAGAVRVLGVADALEVASPRRRPLGAGLPGRGDVGALALGMERRHHATSPTDRASSDNFGTMTSISGSTASCSRTLCSGSTCSSGLAVSAASALSAGSGRKSGASASSSWSWAPALAASAS